MTAAGPALTVDSCFPASSPTLGARPLASLQVGPRSPARPISPPRGPVDQLNTFLAQVGEQVTPGLIRAPPLLPLGAPIRTRRRQRPAVVTRSSARLAGKKAASPGGSVLIQAQRLICRRLRMEPDEKEEIALLQKRYEETFSTPLSRPQLQALSSLAANTSVRSRVTQET